MCERRLLMEGERITDSLEWMLSHNGVAVVKINKQDDVEIVMYSEDASKYKELEKYAEEHNYHLYIGAKKEGDSFGYLRD